MGRPREPHSKSERVRVLLAKTRLKSAEIAHIVGCHDGFVRAMKQRILHPERERQRNNARTDRSYVNRYELYSKNKKQREFA